MRPCLSLPNLPLPQDYNAKPLFARAISQPALGPLVLDKNIAVPGSINTFLREYQRDGIKFFYERYTQRRGGLLGDDMGLVSIAPTYSLTVAHFTHLDRVCCPGS